MTNLPLWNKKRGVRALILALLLIICGQFSFFAAESEELGSRVLRLHILANSDEDSDQQIKLQVRDRILEETAPLLRDLHNPQEAEQVLSEAMPQILEVARDELKEQGSEQTVQAEFCTEYFPTRTYTDSDGQVFTLPAGTYRSLTIRLGEGQGHNWWCVMFPSLCLPAVSETPEQNFTEAETELIRTSPTDYRFRVWEWAQETAQWLGGTFGGS